MSHPMSAGGGPIPGKVLHETIQQLEEVRTRAGTGEVADRLAMVCDRLRSAQAALGRDAAGEACSAQEGTPPTAGRETKAMPPNETERY